MQAISLALTARWAGPADFGALVTVVASAAVLQAVFDGGVTTFVVRERAVSPQSVLLGGALWMARWNAVLLFIAAAAALTVAGYHNAAYWLLLPMAVALAAERNADIWLGIHLADGDAKINTASVIVRRSIVLLILLAGTAIIPSLILLWFALGSAVAGVWAVLSAHRTARRTFENSISRSSLPPFSVLGHFWLNTLAFQARNLDAMILQAVSGGLATSFYGVAARVTGPLRMLPTSLATVLMPAVARGNHSNARVYRLIALIFIGSLVAFSVMATTAPWLVPTFLGDDYSPAVPGLIIVLLGLPFASASAMLSAQLQGRGASKFVAYSALGSTIACLLGVAVFGGLFGATGAAAALSGSFLVQTSALLISLKFMAHPSSS